MGMPCSKNLDNGEYTQERPLRPNRQAMPLSGDACLPTSTKPLTSADAGGFVVSQWITRLQGQHLVTLALRQMRLAHQVQIHLARGAPPLVDGPDHQALPATHVTRGKDARDAGGELAVDRLSIGPRVALHA